MKQIGWLFILGSVVPASAHAAPGKNKGACPAEVQSVCGEHRGDRAARRACIEANRSQFSEVCQAKFARRAQHGRNGRSRGCRSQVKAICGTHRGNPAAMKTCFESHREQFSARCQARLDARDWSQRGGKRGQCRAEVKNLCGAHRGERSAMHHCLKSNFGQFSENCQQRMQRRLARHSHSQPEAKGRWVN